MSRKITKFGLLFLLPMLVLSEARVYAIEDSRLQLLLEKAKQRRAAQSDGKVNTTKTFDETTREVAGKNSDTSTRDLGYQTTKVLSTVDKTPVSKDVQAQIQVKPAPTIQAVQPVTVISPQPAANVTQTVNIVQPALPSSSIKKPSIPTSTKSLSPATKPIPPKAASTSTPQRNPYINGSLDKPSPKAEVVSAPTPRPKTSLQSKREASQAKPSTTFIQRDDKIKDDFVTNTSINLKQDKVKKDTIQKSDFVMPQMPKAEVPKQELAKPGKLGYEDLVVKKQDGKIKSSQVPVIDPHSPKEFSDIDNKKPDEDLINMLQAYKEAVRNEIKTTSKDIRSTAKTETVVVEEKIPEAPSKEEHAASHEQDYLLVLRKSLKSLEEDSWSEVKQNMGESLDYFAREQELHPDNLDLGLYHRIVMGFSRFAEGGLELDEGDFADFEEAEALYLDCLDILEDVKSKIKKEDLTSNNVREIVNTVLKYTDEELEYIEEMIGL